MTSLEERNLSSVGIAPAISRLALWCLTEMKEKEKEKKRGREESDKSEPRLVPKDTRAKKTN
jgi:hypothetical protein